MGYPVLGVWPSIKRRRLNVLVSGGEVRRYDSCDRPCGLILEGHLREEGTAEQVGVLPGDRVKSEVGPNDIRWEFRVNRDMREI